MTKENQRIVLVDAMRGFALLGIVMIHFVEHFDFFYPPERHYFFTPETDQRVFDAVMFLVSGKAYSIFAITFGFSFFIQLSRNESRGIDFRNRFAWRLTLLFCMGILHSLIYRGDILHIYALLGFPLILLYRLSSRTLVIIMLLFLIELPLLYPLLMSIMDPSYIYTPDWGGDWFAQAEEAYAHGSLGDVISVNLWKSRYLVYAWTWYTGRAVQLFALFILGLLLGRIGLFENPGKYRPQLIRALLASVIGIVLIYYLSGLTNTSDLTEMQKELLATLFRAFSNLAYTVVLVTAFILAFGYLDKYKMAGPLAAYGKLSLTNYVAQAVFGVVFFFGFGLGMWKIMGATWSLLAGILFFILQIVISHAWLRYFNYGPLEWLWRAMTFTDFRLKMKR